MTLSTTVNKVSYAGDGTTVSFAIPFLFIEDVHIEAVLRDAAGIETNWALNTQYTLTDAGTAAGGTLTVSVDPDDFTPAVGETLVIRRVVPETQETDYPEGGAFPAAAHEQGLDKLTMLVQQHSEEIARAPVLPVSSSLSDITIPEPGASELLRWNAAGSALETVDALGLNLNSEITAPALGDRLVYDGTLWANRAEGVFNVRDFGATGDGATDDTTAIQAALNGLPADGGTLFFPAGNYIVSSALTVPVETQIKGSGSEISQITMAANNTNCLVCTGPGSFVIENMYLFRDSVTYTGTGTALKMTDTAHARIHHMNITGFDIGLHHNDGFFVHYHDLTITNYFTNGIVLDDKGSLTTADIFLRDISIKHARADTAVGLLIECPNVQVNGLELEEWGALGVHVFDSVNLALVSNIFLNDVNIAGGAARCGGGIKINGATDVRVNNFVFENSQVGWVSFPDVDGLWVTGASAERITVSGAYILNSSRNGIRLDSAARNALFDSVTIDRSGEQGIYITPTSGSTFRDIRIGNSDQDGSLAGTADCHIYMNGAQKHTLDGIFFADAGGVAYGIAEAGAANANRYSKMIVDSGVTFSSAMLLRISASLKTNLLRPAAIFGAQTGEGLGFTGVIYTNLTAGATTAVTTEETLNTVNTPAKALTGVCTVRVRAWGSCAANANAKTIKLKLGTEIIATNDVTTAPNGDIWEIDAVFGHRGAGFDTGTKLGRMIVGATMQTLVGGQFAEVGAFTNATAISVTGQNGIASANDIVCDGMSVEIIDNDA